MSVGRNETMQWSHSPVRDGSADPDTLLEALRGLIAALWRRRLWIVMSALVAILLALTFLAFTNPLYSSTTQILIDPRGKQLLQTEVVPGGLGSSSVGPDTLLVESQVEIILSDAVLGRVVAEARLAEDPEFARPRGGGLSALLIGIGRSPAQASVAPGIMPQTPEAAAVENLRKQLRVKRAGNTYLISVTALSERPGMAQRLSDMVADAYLVDAQDASRDSTRQTTVMLASRLDELREDVRKAESEVEAYRERHGLIGAQDLLINEQQLRDLNDRLTEARTRSSETRVKFESLSRLAERGVDGIEAMSEAIGSTVVANLRASHGEIVRDLSNAEMVYGPRHPRVRALESERLGIARTIEEELARLARNAELEYEVALGHEQSLETRLNELEGVTVVANRALVALREMQREADAARTVYEAFLHRAKQTSEQENLSANNARILARGELPHRPSYPPAALVLAGALLLGLMLGAALAWVRDVTARA